jgi:hypothetical protein
MWEPRWYPERPKEPLAKFCDNYTKHYYLIHIGEFNKWTMLACGLIVLGGVIIVYIIK